MSSEARFLPEADYRRLKAACAAAVRATPSGSAAGFAAQTRVTERSVRLYLDHSSDLFAPLDVIADVEAAANDPIITRVLADLCGFELVKRITEPEIAALAAIKETGEAVAAIAALVSSGARGLTNAKAALAEIREARAALAGLERTLGVLIGEKS